MTLRITLAVASLPTSTGLGVAAIARAVVAGLTNKFSAVEVEGELPLLPLKVARRTWLPEVDGDITQVAVCVLLASVKAETQRGAVPSRKVMLPTGKSLVTVAVNVTACPVTVVPAVEDKIVCVD